VFLWTSLSLITEEGNQEITKLKDQGRICLSPLEISSWPASGSGKLSTNRRVGELTFELVERYVDDLVTVSEDAISNAILRLLETEKTFADMALGDTAIGMVLETRGPEHINEVFSRIRATGFRVEME
jgi:hypothetical protein